MHFFLDIMTGSSAAGLSKKKSETLHGKDIENSRYFFNIDGT
jgi:hypothetical protein